MCGILSASAPAAAVRGSIPRLPTVESDDTIILAVGDARLVITGGTKAAPVLDLPGGINHSTTCTLRNNLRMNMQMLHTRSSGLRRKTEFISLSAQGPQTSPTKRAVQAIGYGAKEHLTVSIVSGRANDAPQ